MSNEAQPSVELQPMDAHKQLWSQHDLLQTILQRFFSVHGAIGGTVLPAWKVSTKDERAACVHLLHLW